MELKFLTPTLLWGDYNPQSLPLETTILNTTQEDNFLCTKYCFTSETTETGRIRVGVNVYCDSRWVDKRPTILILPSLSGNLDYDTIAKELISIGFVTILVDYANSVFIDGDFTSFPEEVNYADKQFCRDYMYEIHGSAKESPWFIWSKIIRRAISFATEHNLVQENRIGILGFGTGGHLTWITAGIDQRVHAAIPVDAGGYLWCNDRKRFGTENTPRTDEESAFSTGVGAETYARFIKCPLLFVLSSNSDSFDLDRCGDIFSLVPSKNKHMMISNNTNRQVTLNALICIENWLKKYLAHDGRIIANPIASFEATENNIMLYIDTKTTPLDITIYYANAKDPSFVRNWSKLENTQKSGESVYVASIPIIDTDEYLTAFANVKYSKKTFYSTPLVAILPEKYKLKENTLLVKSASHIIYNGNMGLGNFITESPGFICDETCLKCKTGPFGIKGISTSIGNLVLYRSSYETFSEDKNILFRFDAYSKEPKIITLSLMSGETREKFLCDVQLKGGEHWQPVALDASMFKSKKGKTLVKFADINKFSFLKAENVIFNNMLWV